MSKRTLNNQTSHIMAKALITVPIDLTESDATGAVLKASENSRLLVFGKTLLGALTAFIGAPAWAIRNLNTALSGATVTRNLHVVKKGTRFFVTQDTATGVNLAEEAQLQFKSFGSFGEFVRRCLDGEISMGSTPATQGSSGTPGKFTLTLPGGSGGALETDGTLVFGSVGSIPVGPGVNITQPADIGAAIEMLLGNRTYGYVVVAQEMGSMTIDVNLTANNDVTEITGDFGTFTRTGYTAPVAGSPGNPANAIALDQIAGTVRFVYIPSIPAGTDLLNVTRDTATLTSIFE